MPEHPSKMMGAMAMVRAGLTQQYGLQWRIQITGAELGESSFVNVSVRHPYEGQGEGVAYLTQLRESVVIVRGDIRLR